MNRRKEKIKRREGEKTKKQKRTPPPKKRKENARGKINETKSCFFGKRLT